MSRTLWKLTVQVCCEIEEVSMHISPFDGEITDRRLKNSSRAAPISEGHISGKRGGVILTILLW
jgi:NADH:ubiquinone oxidoreductase subunit B-like Fe-S oxidoreductase